MVAVATHFADRAAAVLPEWMAGRALSVLGAGGLPAAVVAASADEIQRQGHAAGYRAAEALRDLLGTDVDRQRSTPLAVVRASLGDLSRVLYQVGLSPPARPEALARAGPDDSFALAPSSWSEVDADLAEAALTWGAAKAVVHLRRHRPCGDSEDMARNAPGERLGATGPGGAPGPGQITP